jgi:Xaa-Pro aminopeptidase
MATDTLPDHPALREGRRERAFAAMEAHDLDVLVLGRVANIRYVSGVPILWNAGTRPFGPGCVAVRATREIYLLSTWDEGVPEDIPHDHLYGITWNPMNLVEMLKGVAASVAPARVGTDAMSPLFAQLLPMAFPDAEIVDGGPALRAARRIKTADEVDAIRSAIGSAEVAMDAAVGALRPGVSERELTSVFMDAMASRGVTTPLTQDVVRITSAGAVRTVGTGALVQAGDLVAFDAGVVADGYAGEVGRTWPVGVDRDHPAVDDLYRRWDELWAHLLAACRPGASGTALLDAYAAAGEPLPVMPIGRGLGLGFDDPVIVRHLPETAAAERLDPGVVLVVTGCVFDDAVGSVIAHEAVLITADGPEVLSSSPFWNRERVGADHP